MSKKTNIPVRHRVFLAVAILEVVLFSGTLLGWSSLLFLLKEEGFFHELCETGFVTEVSDNSSAVSTPGSVSSQSCVAQEERFSLVVTLAGGCGNALTAFVGLAVDKLGAKKVRAVARYDA